MAGFFSLIRGVYQLISLLGIQLPGGVVSLIFVCLCRGSLYSCSLMGGKDFCVLQLSVCLPVLSIACLHYWQEKIQGSG